MADRKRRRSGSRFRSDELTGQLIDDHPQDLRDLRVVSGFLGDSARDDHCRVYLNPELTAYYEIARSDVVLTRPFPGAPQDLGGSLVWFERNADIALVETRTQSAAAEFMAGDILGAFLRGIGAGSFDGPLARLLGDDEDPSKPKSFEYRETCYGVITKDYCESRDDVCTILRCAQVALRDDDYDDRAGR